MLYLKFQFGGSISLSSLWFCRGKVWTLGQRWLVSRLFSWIFTQSWALYNNLVSTARKVIELEEEPEEDDNPAPPTIVKEIGSAKGKGKGKRAVSSQVSTRFYNKASVQRTTDPTTTVVGSPSTTLSAIAPDIDHAPSHSGVTVPSVPRKRKAVAPDTSATSSEKSSSLSLIENVDMEELIEDLMQTKVPPLAYRRI